MAKMGKRRVIILTAVTILLQVTSGTICKGKADRDPSTDHVITRYGHYTQLTCCLEQTELDAGSLVEWSKYDNYTQSWPLLTTENTDFLFTEANQVLIIRSTHFPNAGVYRCSSRATNEVEHTEVRKLQLEVIACDPLPRGPYAISPLPCNKTETEVGGDVVLQCAGYFGCDAGGDIRIVQWFVADGNSDQWKGIDESDLRYVQTPFESNDGVKGSNLTIHKVTEGDFNKRFMCILYSLQYLDGQTHLYTTLVKPSRESGDSMFTDSASLPWILAVSAVVVVLIFSLLVTIACLVHKHARGTQKKRNSYNAKYTLTNHGKGIDV